jgi:hypothetical protein
MSKDIQNQLVTNDCDLHAHAVRINELFTKNHQQFVLISAPNKSNNMTFYTLQPCKLDPNNQPELLIADGEGVIYIELDSFLSGFTLPPDQLMPFINEYGEYYYTDVTSTPIDFVDGFAHLGNMEQSIIELPHIVKYMPMGSDVATLLIPCHSIRFWECLFIVYHALNKFYPDGDKEHDYFMSCFYDLMDGLEQFFKLTPEQSLLNGDDSPIFAFSRAFWLSRNPELANIANSIN